MADEDEVNNIFTEKDHQAAYIFNPLEDTDPSDQPRPAKKRRVTKKATPGRRGAGRTSDGAATSSPTSFTPLFNGAETPANTALRQRLFKQSWSSIESRIQQRLRSANTATLDEVNAFVRDVQPGDRIPAAFIMTGPNTASQRLLFEQLGETLGDVARPGRVVMLRGGE
ncbi:hypothetical protein DL546_006507, partial [Coniochaeta pulveracea]